MSTPFLYSTNVSLKLLIQERFRGDIHYAWCSESFDSTASPRYSIGSLVPPSSNPADIYRDLKRSVARQDRHCMKIAEQKLTLKKLAVEWEAGGIISADEGEEIIYLVDHAEFNDWRPLIYVIARDRVGGRLIDVPPEKRAGFAPEYIIEDLNRSEFDIIEL